MRCFLLRNFALLTSSSCDRIHQAAEINSSSTELIDEVQVGLKLDEEQKTLLQQKLQLIEEQFRDETNEANRLKTYLSEQKQSALMAEKIIEDDLKRQGQLSNY